MEDILLEGELYKQIEEFEYYFVTSYGRIISTKRNKPIILHQRYDKDGYKIARLYKNGKKYQIRIHRLVAKAFLENPENKPHINHLNSIRSDNNLSNLEWCTPKENSIHGSIHTKKYIIKHYVYNIEGKVFTSAKEAANYYDMYYDTIINRCNSDKWPNWTRKQIN